MHQLIFISVGKRLPAMHYLVGSGAFLGDEWPRVASRVATSDHSWRDRGLPRVAVHRHVSFAPLPLEHAGAPRDGLGADSVLRRAIIHLQLRGAKVSLACVSRDEAVGADAPHPSVANVCVRPPDQQELRDIYWITAAD